MSVKELRQRIHNLSNHIAPILGYVELLESTELNDIQKKYIGNCIVATGKTLKELSEIKELVKAMEDV